MTESVSTHPEEPPKLVGDQSKSSNLYVRQAFLVGAARWFTYAIAALLFLAILLPTLFLCKDYSFASNFIMSVFSALPFVSSDDLWPVFSTDFSITYIVSFATIFIVGFMVLCWSGNRAKRLLITLGLITIVVVVISLASGEMLAFPSVYFFHISPYFSARDFTEAALGLAFYVLLFGFVWASIAMFCREKFSAPTLNSESKAQASPWTYVAVVLASVVFVAGWHYSILFDIWQMAGYLGYLDHVIQLRGLELNGAPTVTGFLSMVGLAAVLGFMRQRGLAFALFVSSFATLVLLGVLWLIVFSVDYGYLQSDGHSYLADILLVVFYSLIIATAFFGIYVVCSSIAGWFASKGFRLPVLGLSSKARGPQPTTEADALT